MRMGTDREDAELRCESITHAAGIVAVDEIRASDNEGNMRMSMVVDVP